MKKSIFTLTFLLIIIASFGQAWNWAGQSSNSTSREAGQKICEDSTGNVYILGALHGNTSLATSLSSGYFIAKYDINGNCLWSKNIAGRLQDLSCTNNEVYIIGSFTGSLTINSTTYVSQGYNDILIIKLNAVNGNFIWTKTEGGTGDDLGKDIVAEPSGSFYIAADYDSTFYLGPHIVPKVEDYNSVCAKANPSGFFLWAKTVHALDGQCPDVYVTASHLFLDKNYRVYIAGKYSCSIMADTTFISGSAGPIYIIGYNPNGTLMASQRGFTNARWAWIKDLFIDNDHNIYMILLGGDQYAYGYFLKKYNPNFQLKSARTFLSSGGVMPHIADPIGGGVDFDNNVYFAYNFTDSVQLVNGNPHIYSIGAQSVVIEKLDSNGISLSFMVAGNLDSIGCNAICVNAAGKVHVTGGFKDTTYLNSTSLIPDGNWQQFFVAELDYAISAGIATQANKMQSGFSVYPNPTNDKLYLNLPQQFNTGTIRVFNAIGSLVSEHKITNSTEPFTLDTSRLKSGIYFVEVLVEDKAYREKFIIAR